ncbi:hypothetical protein dsx2_3411 [Desulfovibrio sp. X2]|uniref:PD-(D/E)XK nuclease family protein n=1 Tax=Desulfovibrio sp. X2 TaxID=941449 RepID=UPI0003589CDA|nr:PD-(D/E)XK nuclease family protein [Desulfovibrio sp. X2]EPR39358.1 hypothetical protein dsx2_3411 [Desulfovibrio sp. X2]
MSTRPIRIIPWQADFPSALADTLVREHADRMADCLVVFPHHRPARYLAARLTEHEGLAKPCLLPETTTFTELVSRLRAATHAMPLVQAGPLDRVALLHEAVQGLDARTSGLLADLPREIERFLPWGIRLSELMEELMRHGLPPRDLLAAEDEVLPEAAALLGHCEAIYSAYLGLLAREGLTTPGNDCRLVLQALDEVPAVLDGHPLVIAGFYALSGAEDAIFRALWQSGSADVLWHADPGIAQGRGHWCLEELRAWAGRWGARPVVEATCAPAGEADAPTLRFVEAYDRHSELLELGRELARLPEDQAAAVVLPDEALLPPVLHHLPERECNISMGYPLERASLAQLVETLLRLQENGLSGRYVWRDVVALIRHPYLKMLDLHGERPLRTVFRQWEKELRGGEKLVDPLTWAPQYADLGMVDGARAVDALLRRLLRCCLTAFAEARTLAGLAEALRGLCDLLVEHGGELWRDYLLDAECLFRLRTSLLPALAHSRLSHEELPHSVLFAVLRQVLAGERVPFEPEPITGLQVVGMLETRLLRFPRLFVLEATEERLPGTPGHDPLLPDTLRARLGLPDLRARDTVAAYTFFRLLAGAEEAVLFYRQGDAPGLLESTPVRSRFVEMLLWEEEKRRGSLIKPGMPPLASVSLPLSPIRSEALAVEKTEAVRAALLGRLRSKGLSPTALDAYVRCPKSFFLRHVCRLRPPDEVSEDGDPAALGSLVHRVLSDFLAPYAGHETNLAALPGEELAERFSYALRTEPFFQSMPLDARIVLDRTGRSRLKNFLAGQPHTTILALEERFETRLPFAGEEIALSGIVDRLDRRGGRLVVVDYKTGRVQKAKMALWDDAALWQACAEWSPGGDDPLPRLAGPLGSLQLPMYMTLCWGREGEAPADAAWVELADQGAEIAYFPRNFGQEERDRVIRELTPALLRFLLHHMEHAPTFEPVPQDACRYCDVRGPCGA